MNTGYLTAGRTFESDEVYTPEYAITPIIKYLKPNSKIWCPFDSDNSNYVKVFRREGFTVVTGDLQKGEDFFLTLPPDDCDYIISNPPYSIKDDVIERVDHWGIPFALLLPLPTLQGKRRYHVFKKGIEALIFDGRINYLKTDYEELPKGNHFASIYICRGVLPESLVFEKLEN